MLDRDQCTIVLLCQSSLWVDIGSVDVAIGNLLQPTVLCNGAYLLKHVLVDSCTRFAILVATGCARFHMVAIIIFQSTLSLDAGNRL